MAISRKDALHEYLKANGAKGGRASWRGLTKAQRTVRARKAAAKRKSGK